MGEDGKGEGYLGTAHVLPTGPRGQTGLRRGKIWHDAPGICDLTFLCESVRGQEKVFKGTATSSCVQVSGFLSKRDMTVGPDSGRAAWRSLEGFSLNGC